MPEEIPQRRILDKWSDYSYETMTKKLKLCGPSTCQDLHKGFIMQGYLGTPCTMYCCCCFVNYITCGLPCHWYLLNPKTRLEGLFRVFGLPFRFLVSYCFGSSSPVTAKSVLRYLKLLLMSNGGKEQKKSVLVYKWDIPRGKREIPFGS